MTAIVQPPTTAAGPLDQRLPPEPDAAPLSLLGLMSLRRRSLVASVLVFVLAGLGVAVVSPVTYTAQGQLLAAGTSVSAAAVPSFTQAGQSLAQTYSRVFSGDTVQELLRRSGYDPATESVTASPIAATSVILVEAQAPSRAAAVRLADSGVRALTTTVAGLLDNSSSVAAARATLQTAYSEQLEAQATLDSLDKKHARRTSTAYETATAKFGAAQATVGAARSLLSSEVGAGVQANGVSPLASAQVTSSNSAKRFELWGSIGLVAGLAIWLLIAVLRSRSRLGRARPTRRSRS